MTALRIYTITLDTPPAGGVPTGRSIGVPGPIGVCSTNASVGRPAARLE